MSSKLQYILKNGAKNLISTTVYSIAYKFDALTNMEELHIQSRQIYRTTPSYSDLSCISVTYGASD